MKWQAFVLRMVGRRGNRMIRNRLEGERHEVTGKPLAPDTSVASLVNTGRRRLFRGVGGGAGVLMAVSAKSALGGTVCQSPSAAMSGNTSPRPGTGTTCSGGLSPGYWKVPEHAGSWPAAGGTYPTFDIGVVTCSTTLKDIKTANITNPGTVLGNVFAGAPMVSMWYVLYNPNDPIFGTKGQLLRALSAAWLNAGYYSGSTALYPITKSQVVDMWNAVKMGGTYCPASMPNCSSPWTADQVKSYIEGMYDTNAPTVNVCKSP
jgi:hypothetical protein